MAVKTADLLALLERQGERLDALEAADLRRVAKIYEQARLELADTLRRMEAEGRDELTPFTYQRYQATMAQLEAGILQMRDRLDEEFRASLRRQGERSIEDILAVLGRAEAGFTDVAAAVEVGALQHLSQVEGLLLHRHSLDRYTAETVAEIQRRLLVGAAKKQTYRQLREDLFRGPGRPAARNAYESVWLQRQHRLDLIVRMENASASDEVHRGTLQAAATELDVPGDPDPLMARADEFRDHRNHPLSPALHGRLRPLDGDWVVPQAEVQAWQAVTRYKGPPSSIMWPLVGTAYVGRTYPAHYNDRGRQVPWRRSWGDPGEMGPPAKHEGSRVRATRPVFGPDPTRVPTGKPKVENTGSPDNRRSARRENETAVALTAMGFRVEQLPDGFVGPLGGSPDYRVNGRLWDCYSPEQTTLDNIRNTISRKTKRQAPRVILNIADLKVHTLDNITQRLQSAPVEKLLELWALDGDKLFELVDGQWHRVI